MDLVTVWKELKFSSAHVIPYHTGKCRNLHGHTFVLAVGVTGPVRDVAEGDSQSGMVADFYHIGEFLKGLESEFLDHKLLNHSVDEYPTAERVCLKIYQWAAKRLEPMLPELAWVSGIRLYEEHTFPKAWAEINIPSPPPVRNAVEYR